MNLPLWIAGRYLRRRRQSGFITLLTGISIGGVALGVTALLTVLAVMNGFEQEIQTRIAGTDAHVVLLSDGPYGLRNSAALLERLKGAGGVLGVAPFTYTKAMAFHQGVTEGLVVKGVELTAERGVTTIGDHITPPLDSIPTGGGARPPAIVLGSDLAERLGVRPGDTLVLGSLSGAANSALGFAPKLRTFVVAGVFRSGLYTYDSSLGFTSVAAAQDFFGMGGAITGIEVKLADMFAAPAMAESLLRRLDEPGVRANNWIDLNRNLFTWMKLEKTVMFVILALIVLVAAFNIVSTLFMVVLEKRKDIGVLKSLGASRSLVLNIFLYEGLLIGGLGTLLGAVLGGGLIFVLQRYPFVRLPGEVYFIERLPVRPEAGDFAAVILAALALCLAAALYPAWQAARLDPVDAIRRQGVRIHSSSIMEDTANKVTNDPVPALRVRGIRKSYEVPGGRLDVLNGVEFDVPRGTILAILGASGSGKSTLLNILGTLDRAEAGTLELAGVRLDGLSERALAGIRSKRLGFVFQFHHLLPEFDACENVMMPMLIAGAGAGEARRRAQEALESVGLKDRWEHRPAQLSGGEAQRVAVARALVHRPELVLADEPSGNLDSAAATALHDLMSSLARERHQTFVVVTHNDRLASAADRVLTLEGGRVREG